MIHQQHLNDYPNDTSATSDYPNDTSATSILMNILS